MADHRVGKRVRLMYCTDPYTKLPPGLMGTVIDVDDAGTVQVKWDNGSRLGMIPLVDHFELLPPKEQPPYPFCRTPAKCAGRGYCPNDPACND